MVLLLLILLVVGGGLFAFMWLSNTARQTFEAENMARQVELAMDNYEQTSPSELSQNTTLRFLSWNVESGGNDPAVIAEQLAQLGSYDVIALQEVHPSNSRAYLRAVEKARPEDIRSILDEYRSVLSVG